MSDDDLLPPPVPPEADMRGLSFMPLDVGRLLDSDLFALSSGDEFKAAVALWCKCWTQLPASSLPDDDRILSVLSGAGAKWKKVKAMALRNFVKCADGRLYHTLIADKVVEAWAMRLRQRERSQRANEKRWGRNDPTSGDGGSHPNGEAYGDASGYPHGDAVGDPKGQGQCKEDSTHQDSTRLNHLPVGEQPAVEKPKRNQYPKDFEEFWEGYPKTKIMSKAETYSAWRKTPIEERQAATRALPAFRQYCRENPDYNPIHACRFLTKRRADGLLESAERVAAGQGVFVKAGTPQWEAWAQAKGKSSPTNKDGGWYFPAEWPPQHAEGLH